MDEQTEIKADFVQLVRLAVSERAEDVRLYVARLVRKYRSLDPPLAEQLELQLRAKPPRSTSPLRRAASPSLSERPVPVDDESRLSLLKVYRDAPDREQPLLSTDLAEALGQLLHERQEMARLLSKGLQPTRSAIFVGPPGVGKTLTARWLAAKLELPLYVLDLTAVMSSLLGRSGGNLRAAIDFAKREPCVLLLDEIDAIAKRRSDDADVGELKRLVTVILQEVDEWPATSLLLAATNHPDLIDPALWRRFDLVLRFELPEMPAIKEALRKFLGPDKARFTRWLDVLALSFKGGSINDIEREMHRLRRAITLGTAGAADLVEDLVRGRALTLDHQDKIELAVRLARLTRLSQRTVSNLTGISRDTIRKYAGEQDEVGKRRVMRRAAA